MKSTTTTDSFNQQGFPVEKHRIKKEVFEILDPIYKSIAQKLIDEGKWEVVA